MCRTLSDAFGRKEQHMSDTASTIRRVYLHCEFLPADPTVRGLVSIGLTDDAGHDYYAVNNGMDLTAVLNLPWMVDNVWPHLPRCTVDGYPDLLDRTHPDVKLIDEMRNDVARYFADGFPETHLYVYYGSQHICRLHSLWDNDWTAMPPAVPRWCHELQSLIAQAGYPPLLEQAYGKYHALTDAYYTRTLHEQLLVFTACPRCGGDGFGPVHSFHQMLPTDQQRVASSCTERMGESSATRQGSENRSCHPCQQATKGNRLTHFPTRQMHSVVCDVCDYIYDEDRNGLVVFDSPEEAAQGVLRRNWKRLSDGRVICPSDDAEHQAMYDELMPLEPGIDVDG
jgi:hypothetical protein